MQTFPHIFHTGILSSISSAKLSPTRCLQPSLRLKVNLFSELTGIFFCRWKAAWLRIAPSLIFPQSCSKRIYGGALLLRQLTSNRHFYWVKRNCNSIANSRLPCNQILFAIVLERSITKPPFNFVNRKFCVNRTRIDR